MPTLFRIAAVLAALAAVACGDGTQGSGVRPGACASDLDCAPDEVCADRLCVRAPASTILEAPRVDEADAGGPAPFADGGPRLDGGPRPDGGALADGGPRPDGGALADGGVVADGGPGATDGGLARFCSSCSNDGQCPSGMKCVTTERAGERFCSPPCATSDACPLGASCAGFVVNQGSYCLPAAGTCVTGACTAVGCPAETPLCDAPSGRCYRTESRATCAGCTYSYQCGSFWDRCVAVGDARVCGRDCDPARNGTCASGYRCASVSSSTGEAVNQCVPNAGTCTSCRADNPCSATDRTCDIATGTCVLRSSVVPACVPCDWNLDCGATTMTCYQGGCMPYCDTYTPCGTGYRCATINDPERGASVRRCVPNTASNQTCESLLLCLRCASDEDCNGGRCISLGSNNRRCAPRCDAVGSICPSGSSCGRVDGNSVCVPASCPN